MSKVWFITGTSSGFGKALVQALLPTDAQIVATARHLDALADLGDYDSHKLLKLSLDVTSSASIQAAVKQTLEHFGRIDVLVNNAGYGIVGALEETSPEALQSIFATNVLGLVAVTQAVLPIMRAHRKGCIINMSSISGIVVTPGFAAYNATKFAVEGISLALSAEVAHLGIKVTVVEPGPFRTDFAGRSISTMPEIEDYEPTVAKTRTYITQANGTQPGDPAKAAQILIAVADMHNPPLHLPLGNMSVERMKKYFVKRLEEVEKNEALSRSADFAPGEAGYMPPPEFLDEIAKMRLDDEAPAHS